MLEDVIINHYNKLADVGDPCIRCPQERYSGVMRNGWRYGYIVCVFHADSVWNKLDSAAIEEAIKWVDREIKRINPI